MLLVVLSIHALGMLQLVREVARLERLPLLLLMLLLVWTDVVIRGDDWLAWLPRLSWIGRRSVLELRRGYWRRRGRSRSHRR